MSLSFRWGIIRSFLSTQSFDDSEHLHAFQQAKLQHLLSSHNSRFYPHSTRLEDYPIINKRIFMQNFSNINRAGIAETEALDLALKAETSRDFSPVLQTAIGPLTVGLSSGTSGSRGVFLVSPQETAKWAGYILRRLLPKPWLQSHRIAFFLRANSNLYTSVNSRLIQFKFYDLLSPLSLHLADLNQQQPTILIAPAQVLGQLADMPELKINPKKIISVAEVLEPDIQKRVEQRFNMPVSQVYQCTEGFLAHTCSHQNWHLNEDLVHIEKDWLDQDSGRFSPIITDFNRFTQPVIRYRLDDVLVLDENPCPCGSVFTRLRNIEGRCDDVLRARTLDDEPYALYPDFIRRALISASTTLQEYRVEQHGRSLHIQIEPLDPANCQAITQALTDMCANHHIQVFDLQFFPYQTQSLDTKLRRIRKVSP